jgi:UDP-N-acetyl-D-glucosamine dehydrogenase
VTVEPRDGTRDLDALAERIRTKEAVVGVIGLGYVGLPLLVAARKAGYPVVGLDTAEERIGALREGQSYLTDVTESEVNALDNDSLSTDWAILQAAEVVAITVPTPLVDQAPDLSYVEAAAEAAGKTLGRGNLVILESTTYPGTTEEVVLPLLEKHSGLTAGEDFALAYSPERINPGQDEFGVEDIPKVVGGLTERCRDLAVSFYQGFIRQVVATSGPREAELAKLIENTFRHVNIALVNELAIVAKELDVDIWEAISAAATKPFGFMPFWPGPGVGGHCIPIDPSYLSWRVTQRLGYSNGFIEHANGINRRMPRYIVDRVTQLLNDNGIPVKGAKVLAIGAAYKPGVSDLRDSPALEVMELLAKRGAVVSYHDEFAPEISVPTGKLTSVPLTDDTLRNRDCVLILTAQAGVDWQWVVEKGPLIFDTRGVTERIERPGLERL